MGDQTAGSMTAGRFASAAFSLLAGLLLVACTATAPVPYCCYQGDAVSVFLNALYFELESGERKTVQEVLPGLEPDRSLFTWSMAFDEADVDLVVYPALRRKLSAYDANADRKIEPPELTVIYLVEGARGLGHPVRGIATDRPVRAVNLAQDERGGLVRYLKARRAEMNPAGRVFFQELEQLGNDLRSHTDGIDRERDSRIIQP